MHSNKLLALIFALSTALPLASCDNTARSGLDIGGSTGGSTWGGPGTGGGGTGGGGGGTATLTFDGPTDASPTSSTAVSVTWNAAVLTVALGDDLVYDVFRDTAVDMLSETLVGTTAVGELSMLDESLASDQTYFYRVVARTAELSSDNVDVVSAHLPAVPPTPMDYMTDIDPLWARLGNDGITTCLDCHDGTNAVMDLRTWEGLQIGVGTPSAPDSFISPGFGAESFRDAVARLVSHTSSLNSHKMWASQAVDYKTALEPWIDQGATQETDLSSPTFSTADLQNSALYNVVESTATRITLTFPHALDPESVPYAPQAFDHLRYLVYAGPDSNSIDWDTPIKKVPGGLFPLADPSLSFTFNYAEPGGTFVVRALDFSGNESLNEIEIVLERTAVE
jgi:hypothetical protein